MLIRVTGSRIIVPVCPVRLVRPWSRSPGLSNGYLPLVRTFVFQWICLPKRGETRVIQVGSPTIHLSHRSAFHAETGFHFCTTCGATGRVCLDALASECTYCSNSGGRQNMVRLSKGLMPGESAAALPSAPAGPFWRVGLGSRDPPACWRK